MNFTQKQYELGFFLLNNPDRFSVNHYFKNLSLAKDRIKPSYLNKKQLPKKVQTEPYKDYETAKSLQKLQLRIDTIYEKQALPKINKAFVEVGNRLKINKEKSRELASRALSLENIRFSTRIMNQKPRIMSNKLLEKLYNEKHEKYIERIKNVFVGDISKFHIKLPKLIRREKSRTSEEGDKSMKLKEHKHNEILHQTQGHIDGTQKNNDNKEVVN